MRSGINPVFFQKGRPSVCHFHYVDAAVWRRASVPEIFLVSVHILKQGSYRTAVGCDEDRFVLKVRITGLFLPELPGAPDDIFDIFSAFRSFIIPGILKKSLQIFIQDISLLILENLPLKNAEIDLPDPFVGDHRYLTGSFSQYMGGRLAGAVKGTG